MPVLGGAEMKLDRSDIFNLVSTNTPDAPSEEVWRAIDEFSQRGFNHAGLRFEAACHAMQGLLANNTRGGDAEEFAADAVAYADALLAELGKGAVDPEAPHPR
jgi:hypothetical protein